MKEQTSKKIKIIGTETYINQKTGEIQDMQVVSIEDRDFNFHKLWLSHIINSLDLIGNKKVKLAFWIIENLNRENQLIMTMRQISDKSNISLETVRITMKALIDSNFLVKINNGAYQVNPDAIFKGTHNGRLNVLYQYSQAKTQEQKNKFELSPEEKKEQKIRELTENLNNMQKNMERVLKKLQDLQNGKEQVADEPEAEANTNS